MIQFEQFSRTVTNAAIEQQIRIQHGLKSFENSMTSSALSTNSVWPFFVMPNFEQHARDVSVFKFVAVALVYLNCFPQNV